MYDILSVDLNETMQYLDGISKEDISYVCSVDIECAKEMLY